MPGGGGGPVVLPPSGVGQLITFPKEYFKPIGGNDFNLNGFNAGQLLANNVVELASVTLPKNEQGIIRSVVIGVGNFNALGAVLFQVRIAGAAAPGWGGLAVPPQAATFVSFAWGPDETSIEVPFGAKVSITAQITSGGPFDMFGALHGWSWGTL